MHSIVLCSMSVNGFNEIPASLSDGSLDISQESVRPPTTNVDTDTNNCWSTSADEEVAFHVIIQPVSCCWKEKRQQQRAGFGWNTQW